MQDRAMHNAEGPKSAAHTGYGLSAGGVVARLLSDALVTLTARRAAAGAKRRVLVVRLDNMGDFLLWQDAARGLREAFPPETHEITLLARDTWGALTEPAPYADRVWTWNRERFLQDTGYRRAQLKTIRRAGFHTVVQARPWRDFLVEDAVTRASGASVRVGFARPAGGSRVHWFLDDRLYTVWVPFGAPDEMELKRNARLVRTLGVSNFAAQRPCLAVDMAPPPALTNQNYFVLFPGADWAGRRWPPARFVEIARRLHAATGWTGIVCGGPGDKELGRALTADPSVPTEDWTGRTTLPELAGVMRGARLVVSNETGGAHMAAAVGTPCVCITGGGHYGRFVPYRAAGAGTRPLPVAFPMPCFGCDWHCIYSVPEGAPTPCIEHISVDAVWAEVQELAGTMPEAAPATRN